MAFVLQNQTRFFQTALLMRMKHTMKIWKPLTKWATPLLLAGYLPAAQVVGAPDRTRSRSSGESAAAPPAFPRYFDKGELL